MQRNDYNALSLFSIALSCSSSWSSLVTTLGVLGGVSCMCCGVVEGVFRKGMSVFGSCVLSFLKSVLTSSSDFLSSVFRWSFSSRTSLRSSYALSDPMSMRVVLSASFRMPVGSLSST